MGTARSGLPWTLRAAAVVVAIEAVGAIYVGAWLIVATLLERPRGLGIAVSSGIFVLAVGVGLGVLAYGLTRVRRWSRGLTVALQLLGLPLGYELVSGGTWPVGAAMLVCAVVALALILAPRSTERFRV
ncbi:hypothetical protein [Thermasporomyces composti]|uniref:Integral membrane protein n=1 Tax=Thermasporomyces composti TaxID=696763 RepID=A0A3D9V275_THECX|nr:hypothetical protein [Thermasporomyces composti]REF35466.1 hypothetical protein DFJ64_0846 [Thermasporomyces composti]